jgi:hypothetical protein
MDLLRHNGKWYKVSKKPYEPETQTTQVAWLQILNNITAQEAYRRMFAKQREDAQILYPSFRKDVD